MTVMRISEPSESYPLCVPGDTLMNRDELIRYVRQKCGDEVGRAVEEIAYETSVRKQLEGAVISLENAMRNVENSIDSMNDFVSELKGVLNEA